MPGDLLRYVETADGIIIEKARTIDDDPFASFFGMGHGSRRQGLCRPLRSLSRQRDIVVLPFPYADRLAEKRRPGVVVSKPALARDHGFDGTKPKPPAVDKSGDLRSL